MYRLVVISVLLTAVSSSQLSCLKSVEDKFNQYKILLTDLKTSLINEKNDQNIDQRGSSPLDVFGTVAKLPGQVATIFGTNGITGITNNLNQMLSNVQLVDSTLQNVMTTLNGVFVIGGKRKADQELIKSFINDFSDTMGSFKGILNLIKDIMELAAIKP